MYLCWPGSEQSEEGVVVVGRETERRSPARAIARPPPPPPPCRLMPVSSVCSRYVPAAACSRHAAPCRFYAAASAPAPSAQFLSCHCHAIFQAMGPGQVIMREAAKVALTTRPAGASGQPHCFAVTLQPIIIIRLAKASCQPGQAKAGLLAMLLLLPKLPPAASCYCQLLSLLHFHQPSCRQLPSS